VFLVIAIASLMLLDNVHGNRRQAKDDKPAKVVSSIPHSAFRIPHSPLA
jgi:hypothetical protein